MSIDLFDSQNEAPVIDPNKSYVDELVGENRKFKDVESLARGKAEADAYIASLTRTLDELKQELSTRARAEDMLTRLLEKPNTPSAPPSQPPVGMDPPQVATTGPTAEDLDKMIRDRLAERETLNTRTQNATMVMQTLTEVWGPAYKTTLQTKAAELGLSPEAVNRMAGESPKALLKLVGADAQKPSTFTGAPTSSVASGFVPSNTERTMSWYQALKAKDPTTYFDKKTQTQMHKDAQRLGERFFDK
jgi:hypothetical protein